MVNNISQKAYMTGAFIAAGIALIAGKKGLEKLYTKGSSFDTQGIKNCASNCLRFASGPTAAGILSGTSTAFSYQLSPLVSKVIAKKPEYEYSDEDKQQVSKVTYDTKGAILTRAITITVSTFALTFLGVKYVTQKMSTHQVTLLGRISYGVIGATASLNAVIGTPWLFDQMRIASKEDHWDFALCTLKVIKPIYKHSDRNREFGNDAYARHTNPLKVKLTASLEIGVIAGVVTGVAAYVLYLVKAGVTALGNAVPAIKGTVPTATVLASTYLLSEYALEYVPYFKEKHSGIKLISSLAIATIVSMALTPTVSSVMLKNRISYGAAAGFSLLGAAGFIGLYALFPTD